eukprot:SAG11_NODE_1494_length_4803_cov_1.551233_4_plen_198_part_00
MAGWQVDEVMVLERQLGGRVATVEEVAAKCARGTADMEGAVKAQLGRLCAESDALPERTKSAVVEELSSFAQSFRRAVGRMDAVVQQLDNKLEAATAAFAARLGGAHPCGCLAGKEGVVRVRARVVAHRLLTAQHSVCADWALALWSAVPPLGAFPGKYAMENRLARSCISVRCALTFGGVLRAQMSTACWTSRWRA